MLLENNDVLVIIILRKIAVYAPVFLKGLVTYELAGTKQFESFVITGTDFNQKFFHEFIRAY